MAELGKYHLVVLDDGIEKTLNATEEQVAIIDAALTTSDSMMLNALAGAAKTSTLQFLAKYMPVVPTLCLAFNKRIADEMGKKLPGHVKCQTLNSLGHGIWMRVSSKRVTVDKDKLYRIMKQVIEDMRLSRRDKEDAYEVFADALKIARQARIQGYIPPKGFDHAKRLIDAETFWETIFGGADDYPLLIRALVDQTLQVSITEAYNGTIDFDDQIYMPTLFGGSFPRFPVVMVDEAQDLSPLNHEMLKKLSPDRLIAVGDPWQSIYAFRGAVFNGMRDIAEHFHMVQFTLSVSFRCPRAVVRRAHLRVPHMKWADWAEEGEVNALEAWNAKTIPDGAAIICRNNAPLFRLAFDLIRGGRGIELRGFDIGPNLIKALKKFIPKEVTHPDILCMEDAYNAIDHWEQEKLRKSSAEGTIKDRAECLRVFVDIGKSLRGAISYAETIFQSKGPIQLLSGHKSKGLEWGTVFHLDPWRVPSKFAIEGTEEFEQELNVRYVIETRAKRNLFLISMEGFDA
jgi:superfamily I DNA/RNA helicase